MQNPEKTGFWERQWVSHNAWKSLLRRDFHIPSATATGEPIFSSVTDLSGRAHLKGQALTIFGYFLILNDF